MKRQQNRVRSILHILCALALFAVGFAHKTPVIAAQIPASQLSAYMLPDGTIPEICDNTVGDDGEHKGHLHNHGCEACRISSHVLMVHPPQVGGPLVCVSTSEPLPAYQEAFYRHLFPPNAAPRAPPLPA